ncbi:MAG: hypothetical protein KBH81_14275 [Phycisphaerae bacterium]|jgi:hypothetical protein|nr:hypothetical protein [Phycisphaerae bacterium]
MGQQVMARRPIGYSSKDIDRGQVFELAGARNDEKLLRLGYLEAWKGKRNDLHECAACGALFVGGNEREGHYEKRHVRVQLTPDQEDSRAEREERFLNEVAPIYLEKVAA